MLEMLPRNTEKLWRQKKVELFEIYSYDWPPFQDKRIQGKDYY